jgi:hypothetical protein
MAFLLFLHGGERADQATLSRSMNGPRFLSCAGKVMPMRQREPR